MKKILTILNYIVKVFFSIIGIMAIIGFFSDDVSSDWSVEYQERLDAEIDKLHKKIDLSADSVEQVHYTLKLVELEKRKVYLHESMENFNESSWSSILQENGIEGAIEYLRLDANFVSSINTEVLPEVRSGRWLHKALLDSLTKEQRYYILYLLYDFKSIMNESQKDKEEAKKNIENSIAEYKADWNLYQYGEFLVEQKSVKAIEVYKEALSLCKEQEFCQKITYKLAKSLILFEYRDEGVSYYKSLLNSDYKNISLIKLATLLNNQKAIEYFNQIDETKVKKLNEKFNYMEAKANVAMIYRYEKEYKKSKLLFESVLEFYHDMSASNPDVFVEIAKINRQLYFVYKGLGMTGSEDESLKRAIFYYKSLNLVYKNKYIDEVEKLKKLQREIGE